MILEARNISFRYGEKSREILKDFSLKAESTERVGLVAPSGFGKTTLCKILSGYEKPDSGQVLLDGKPLDFYGSYCPVQLIWQHPEQAINPRLRMRSVLEEGDNVSPDLIKRLGIEADWMNRFRQSCPGEKCRGFVLQERWDRGHSSFWRMRSAPCWISSHRVRSGISLWMKPKSAKLE